MLQRRKVLDESPRKAYELCYTLRGTELQQELGDSASFCAAARVTFSFLRVRAYELASSISIERSLFQDPKKTESEGE